MHPLLRSTRPPRAPRLGLACLLGLIAVSGLAGCASHEHLHVYGRVYDASGPRNQRLADAELWVVSATGAPLRPAGLSDQRGEYELELAPAERGGGVGVRKPGYQPEWWPLGELSREERRAHTKRLVLRLLKDGVARRNPRHAGSPFAEVGAAAEVEEGRQ